MTIIYRNIKSMSLRKRVRMRSIKSISDFVSGLQMGAATRVTTYKNNEKRVITPVNIERMW